MPQKEISLSTPEERRTKAPLKGFMPYRDIGVTQKISSILLLTKKEQHTTTQSPLSSTQKAANPYLKTLTKDLIMGKIAPGPSFKHKQLVPTSTIYG